MNDTKVVRYEPWCTENTAFMETDEEGTYVTHADYQRRDDEANSVVADMQERYAKLHADYSALEEEVIELRKSVGQDTDTITRLEEELAALRVRHEMVRQCCMAETVRATRLMGDLEELQKKADELYSADQAFDGAWCGGSREEQVHAGMRRRLALEAFK